MMRNNGRRMLILASWVAGGSVAAQPAVSDPYDEPYRPQYHFSADRGWLGDPDGLIHYNGSYSLFWWGKARSDDLVHYVQESRQVMTGEPGNVRYFSGSVVVDARNTAGFGANALVAVYTVFDPSTRRQAQGISFSTDAHEFHFFPGNPVLDIGSTEFRDPNVFWYAPTSTWIMAVALARERSIRIYTSTDLKAWKWQSDFTAPGVGQEAWECPDLFELPIDGDPKKKKWVLVVSVDWSHEMYFIGDFDGTRFRESNEAVRDSQRGAADVDLGLDFYASRTFRDYDNTLHHSTSVGWISTWAYANQVPSSWGKGFWSIPRDVALKSYPTGLHLIQSPIEGLKSLRLQRVAFVARLAPGTRVLPKFHPTQNVYEIDASFGTDVPNRFGLDLCVGSGHKLAIRYDSGNDMLLIDRRDSSAVAIPRFARETTARVAAVNHRLRLHIFVDKSSVEIFANDGREVFTLLTYAGDLQTKIRVFAEHSGTTMRFNGWPLKSIWHNTTKR